MAFYNFKRTIDLHLNGENNFNSFNDRPFFIA